MAVQSIKRVFTSFHTIAQYLAGMGITEPSRHISLYKIIVLRPRLIAESATKRLPNGDSISIAPSHSIFAATTDNNFPQKLITIACLHLLPLWAMCDQIQKLRTKEKHLCLVDGVETAGVTHYRHNSS